MRGPLVARAPVAFALGVALLFATGARAAAPPSPEELMEKTTDEVLSRLRADREELNKHPDRIYDLIEKLVLPHFDFERMSRLVLGRYWRQATPDQRKRFVEQFRLLLVRTYGTALLQYTDQKIRYQPLRAPKGATDVTIDTQILQSGGSPISVQYSLEFRDGEWKVYDVVMEGVSLVINYRGSFSDQIRRDGLESLIQKLVAKNKQDGQ